MVFNREVSSLKKLSHSKFFSFCKSSHDCLTFSAARSMSSPAIFPDCFIVLAAWSTAAMNSCRDAPQLLRSRTRASPSMNTPTVPRLSTNSVIASLTLFFRSMVASALDQKDIDIRVRTVTVHQDVVNTVYQSGIPAGKRIILSLKTPCAVLYRCAFMRAQQKERSGQKTMSSRSPNDPKIPDKDAGARLDPQPQKHFGSPIEEDAIPWAEIIL